MHLRKLTEAACYLKTMLYALFVLPVHLNEFCVYTVLLCAASKIMDNCFSDLIAIWTYVQVV